jgi:hypothetical protein
MKLLSFFSFCLILSLSHSACGPQKNLTDNGHCRHSGVIKDFAGLDGCGLMIIDEKGQKLLPVKFPEQPLELKDGQKIKFDYTEADAMSICMAEDKIVEVTCIKIITKTGDAAAQCIDVSKPMDVDWMKAAINLYSPEQIVKFATDDQWLYLIKGDKAKIFDCYGVKVCDSEETEISKCMNMLPEGAAGQVIWQREYKND